MQTVIEVKAYFVVNLDSANSVYMFTSRCNDFASKFCYRS